LANGQEPTGRYEGAFLINDKETGKLTHQREAMRP
jgi:hypothetical protein